MDRTQTMRLRYSWLVAAGALCLAATGLANPALAAAAPQVEGSSQPTAASGVRRDGHHTATQLADGRVLVAGGGEPAQVFDPSAGSWTPTKPMVDKRSSHTATLLANGKVLVVGGVGEAGPLAAAELFDPATATWAPTGALTLKRYAHTATLLGDGKVLAAGGLEAGHGPFRREAEVFDPTTGAWSSAGAMELGRAYHTATLLPDDKVLVAGGQGTAHDESLTDAVIFDPAARTWAAVPRLMSGPRAKHSATLLAGGTVLLAGGTRQREGEGPNDVLVTAEIYDPKASSFRPAPSMVQRRVSHTATLLPDGRVYVLGGAGTADESGTDEAASAEVFDPAARRWLPVAPVTAAPRLHTATLLGPNGCGENCAKVLVVSPTSAQLSTPPAPVDAPAKTKAAAEVGSNQNDDSGANAVPMALALGVAAVVAVGGVVVWRRRSRGTGA